MLLRSKRFFAGIAAVALGTLFVVATPTAEDASAVGSNDLLVQSVATFSDPLRPDGTATVRCVNYGTGDPTTFSGTDNQSTTWGASNQIRSGSQFSVSSTPPPPCWSDPAESSGLGFDGVDSASPVGEFFEIGRFTHYNNTVSNSLHWVNLNASMRLTNPFTLATEELDTAYRIRLQESPEQFQILGPAPTTDQCQYQPGGTNNFAGGATVPDYVSNYNTGPESFTYTDPNLPDVLNPITTQRVSCADSVYVQPLDPNNPVETLQWGQTSVRVGIAGWAPVVNGVCDAENTVLGPVIYTPESQDTELCMLGQITPASLTVTKLVEDMPDAEFTFELVEQDQGQDPLSDDTSNRTEFSIETANARGDENLGSIEPGLYRLDEIDVPAGYEMTDLSCINAATEESILTEDGLLDIDSGVAASCVVTNGPRTTADLTLVKSVDGGSAEATAWILSAEGPTPISGTSGSAGVTSAKVQPGTYTLAESGGPDGYEQTDLACTAGNDTVPVEGEQITLSVGQDVTCTFTNTATVAPTPPATEPPATEPPATEPGDPSLSATGGELPVWPIVAAASVVLIIGAVTLAIVIRRRQSDS